MLKATLNEKKDKNTVISPMSLSTIVSITQNGAGGRTKEEMPKLHMEYEQELNKMLMSFGMKGDFKPGADFSKMSKDNDLFISIVKQKSYIDVDEKGTEAAAATAVIMNKTSEAYPNKMREFIVDRPFIYVITDNKTDSILFMGTVEKP